MQTGNLEVPSPGDQSLPSIFPEKREGGQCSPPGAPAAPPCSASARTSSRCCSWPGCRLTSALWGRTKIFPTLSLRLHLLTFCSRPLLPGLKEGCQMFAFMIAATQSPCLKPPYHCHWSLKSCWAGSWPWARPRPRSWSRPLTCLVIKQWIFNLFSNLLCFMI